VRRVLLIDDSKAVRSSMQAALDPCGLEVDQAGSGPVALEKLTSGKWDLVYLDLALPEMDGIAVLREMRRRGVKVPVVVVTKVMSSSTMTAAVKLGAVNYILEPFTAEQIRSAAVRTLNLKANVLEAPAPRLLVERADEAILAELRQLLPAHVIVDTPTAPLTKMEDVAVKRPPDVILLDGREGFDELLINSGVLRQLAPVAAILGIMELAKPDEWWAPQRSLDGIIPRAFDEAAIHDFLYLNFLRRLVFESGRTRRAAGFQGDRRFLPAYFQALGRHLIARAANIGLMQDVCIDLSSVPAEPEPVVELIVHVTSKLRASGAAPSVKLSEAMLGSLAPHPRLARVPLLSP
jgi:CheY-like chemotaxis protein